MSKLHRKKVLIVDDALLNRSILQDILSDDFEVEALDNGADALKVLKERHDEFGIMLLDLRMDGVDGFQVLEQMNEWKMLDTLPVIVISAEDSEETENRTLDLHATDFIRKPFDASVVLRRVNNTYDLYSYKNNLESLVSEQTKEIREQNARIQAFNENMVELLGMVVEYRHSESGQHVHRVKAYTELLCKCLQEDYPEYKLTDSQIERIGSASVLHDLGKIAIPDNILLKPGRLTEDEFNQMKQHTVLGDELVGQVKGAWDEDFAKTVHEICRHHHERYDGRGYPDGLKGEDIPIAAQAVSVADVYDALVTDRVYKAAYTPDEAYNMIQNGECGTLSPKLLKCLEKLRPTFEAIVANGKAENELGGGGLTFKA